jgi:hypothetical protein
MFNQTIPKQKRPFLGLKVHSLTQNMRRQRYRGVESNLFHQFLRLVTFYINMLMPKLFKHVNCPAILYAYSISEKRMVCRHIDKPIEIHDNECSKTRKIRFYASVNTGWTTKPLLPLYIRYVHVDAKIIQTCELSSNFFSAFAKPCIPLKTSMKSLFMSRNGHDKNMTKMYITWDALR